MKWGMAWRQVASVALGVVIALGFVWFEPFNLDDGGASSIRSVWGRVAAFEYPVEKSPRTVAVIVDDGYLQSVGASYPFPFADPEGLAPVTHADLITSIADLSPKAIFVNFRYVWNRDPAQTQVLADTLRELSASVPIYLVLNSNAGAGLPVPALDPIARLASEPGARVHFVSAAAGERFGDARSYPIWDAEGNAYTAAAQLYLDTCPKDAACVLPKTSAPMDPQWSTPKMEKPKGAAADVSFNCDMLKERSEEAFETSCSKAERSGLIRFLREAVSATPWRPSNPILVGHIPLVSPDLLSDQRVQEDIRGAVVFVGSNIGVGDSTVSPLQGRVPSVLLHATAYDNLVAFDGRYLRARPPFGLKTEIYQTAMILVVAVFVVLVRILVGMMSPRASRRALSIRQKYAEFAVQTAAVLAWVWADLTLFHSGPWVWGGVLLAIFSGSVIRSMELDGLFRRRKIAENPAS